MISDGTINFQNTRPSLPTVSVIIPTFNRAEFICSAIKSVLKQTYSDFELIVVDDGSTDDTGLRVRQLNDSRLKYIWQPNHGRSHARNRAILEAKGSFIAFLDSDDLYLPEKLALQVDYFNQHPEVSMIYTSAYCINEAGNRLPETYEATVSGHIYQDIAFFRPVTITLPTVMVRRKVLRRYRYVAANFQADAYLWHETQNL